MKSSTASLWQKHIPNSIAQVCPLEQLPTQSPKTPFQIVKDLSLSFSYFLAALDCTTACETFTMCEQISILHSCGHYDRKDAAPCSNQPLSAEEKEATRMAGLKGLPRPLPWCPFQGSYSAGSRRLCPDCRKERRVAIQQLDSHRTDERVWWKVWTSKESAADRAERKRQEAELEARWIKHEYGREENW